MPWKVEGRLDEWEEKSDGGYMYTGVTCCGNGGI